MAHRSMRPRTTDLRKQKRRDTQSALEGIYAKTARVLLMLKNRVAGNRVSATMADAADLIETLSSSSCTSSSSASGMLDVTGGTGDGGGENEAHQGLHAYFENFNPGYVRRRCIPHIFWWTPVILELPERAGN